MKLPILLLVAAGLLPAAVSAQHSMVDDDGTDPRRDVQSVPARLCRAPASLCTDFNTNNGFAGNMFDIEPTVSLEITAIDVNVDGVGQQVDVDVWYIPGTSFGSESNAAGWTLIGSYSGISAGADLPSFIDMAGNGVQFIGGQTYGIYVDITSYSSGTSINYTNGDHAGDRKRQRRVEQRRAQDRCKLWQRFGRSHRLDLLPAQLERMYLLRHRWAVPYGLVDAVGSANDGLRRAAAKSVRC